MTEHTQVPVTWVVCGHKQTESRNFDRRLHAVGDELHDQQTKMKEGRYHWALHPDESVILCYDTVTHYVSEWYDIGDEDRWVVE
jgi:lysozyme family protein